MCCRLFLTYFFLIVFNTQYLLASEKFKFVELSHEKDDPDSYTLVCLDSNLIPISQKADEFKKRDEFNPIRNWLRKELLMSMEEGEDSKELHIVERGATDGNFYLIMLCLKPNISPSERLTTRLWGGTERKVDENRYSASMLIFPQSASTHALAYLLGDWSQLLNPHAVINDWGLRLAASQAVFSDQNIKTMLGKNNFDPNPTTRREKKQRLDLIENFRLEVGTEGLQSLTVLPKYALGTDCQRLAVGSDWYKFFLPAVEEEGKGDTIVSLASMANYLFGIYRDKRAIHPKLQCHLDDEEVDAGKIEKLNEQLAKVLVSDSAKWTVFPADNIWKSYGCAPLFSYLVNKKKRHILEALQGQKLTLNSLISIKKSRSANEYQEPIGRIVYSLPIESEDGGFYRFDRGRWFRVAPSRFGSIIKKLRSPDVKVRLEALIPYSLDDAIGDEGKGGGHYQEDRYNRRVITELEGKKQKGILLDRLNIYFQGAGNQFEFGDMLLYGDKGEYYIVHVKRREAGDIDHHRAQVERCAEYLATELKKENAKDLLLQGCVNGLYMQHDISLTKIKGQEKRLTHSDYFKEVFSSAKRGKKAWGNFLNEKIFNSTKGEASKPTGKLRVALKTIDLSFFEEHQEELIVALDGLYDCARKSELSKEEVNGFLKAVRQLIEIRSVLFPSGLLTDAIRKKITIVMAVIDDREIETIKEAQAILEKIKKGEVVKRGKKDLSEAEAKEKIETLKRKKRSEEEALFKKQQLWGLDRTLQLVQKHRFRFNIVVVNENTERLDWDAFGSTIEEHDVPVTMSIKDSDEEDADDKKPSPKKKKGVNAKKPQEKDKASSGESGSTNGASDEDEALPIGEKISKYRYTSTDINRLLHVPLSHDLPADAGYNRFSLSGGAADEAAETSDIVHYQDNGRYVLPPVIAHMELKEEKTPYETLLDLLADSFFNHDFITAHPPEEIIIPFNPGGHWVTFQILTPAVGNITFKYIDSLSGKKSPSGDMRLLLAFLRGKYLGKTITFESLRFRIQPDSVSCGAITVENIKTLFRQADLGAESQTNPGDMLALKTEHRDYLTGIGKDFDWD